MAPPTVARAGHATGAALTAGRPSGFSVEMCDASSVVVHEQAWSALASRALEPNVFLEPGFALPAIRHFPPAQRPVFLLVWSTGSADGPTLVGLCALRPRPSAYGRPMSVAWTHEQATLNAPLLDRDCAADALDALLLALARTAADWGGLLLQGVAADGPLMRLLAAPGRRHAVVDRRSRPVLHALTPAERTAPRAGSRHHDKDLKRQRRRLFESAPCAVRSASSLDDVRSATEQFLHLEARGWKGGRGTALLNDAGLAAFTRAMTRQLARAGLCRIDSLDVDGQPVAMGIVLRSGDRSFFWKTAYDERFRRHSPGKQLAHLIGERQLADATVALTDSCAIPDHSMIAHVWRDTMTVADLLVAPASTDPAHLARTRRIVGLVRAARGVLKTVYGRLRRVLQRG